MGLKTISAGWAVRLRAAVLLLSVCASAGAQTIRLAYDDANRLTRVTAPDGKAARYTYDAAGRLVTTERDLNPKDGQPHVLETYRRYDAASRIVSIAHVRKSGGWDFLVAGQAISRSTGGGIQGIDTFRAGVYDVASGQFTGVPAVAQAFEYDGNARLTRERRTKGGSTTDTRYEYDFVGNRRSKIVTTSSGTESTQYTYDVADRLKEERTALASGDERVVAYGWDGNGNLAEKTEPGRTTLYRFNAENRLIDMRVGASLAQAQAAAPSISYAYDAQGNRVRKRAGDEWGYLIAPSGGLPQLVVESWSTGRSYYVRGVDIVRQNVEGGPLLIHLFPLHGHLGTSMGAVNASGEVVEEVDADAFGNLDQPTGLRQSHTYAGEFWDQDTQLLYLRARWYDPKMGRFLSPDPFEGKQRDPRSLNRYNYAHQDPVQHSDPTGRFSMTEASASGLMLGVQVSMGAVATAGITGAFATKLALATIASTVGTYALVSHAEKLKLQECMDSAKTGQHKCKPEFAMFIMGDDFNEVRDHIGSALADGKHSMLSAKAPSHNRGWIEKFKGVGKPCSGEQGTQCDEYPFAASMEGGSAGNVSLRSVDGSQNGLAGIQLRWFYEKCNIPKNDASKKYKVVAVHGVDTGYVCSR